MSLLVHSHKHLGESNGTPLQYSCLENPTDGGAWWAAVHGVAKSRTRLSDFPFTFHFHALEKEMATHSSVLAWRIPETGEPGGLPSLGLHGVRHDWSDLAAAEYLKSTITLKSLKIFLHYYLDFTVAVEMLTVSPHIVTLQVEFLLWPHSCPTPQILGAFKLYSLSFAF